MIATAKDTSLPIAALSRVKRWGPGTVFVPRDLFDLAPSRGALDMALRRLVDAQKIRRLGRGLYDFPRVHKSLGPLSASADEIARAVARSTGETVVHSGAKAANLLRLSTQVPARPVYLTSGTTRDVQVGNLTIQFRHAAPSRIVAGDTVPGLVLRALGHLGAADIDDDVIAQVRGILSQADRTKLAGLRSQAPGWMQPLIQRIVDANDPRAGSHAT